MSEQRKEAWSELVAASSEAVKQDFSKESGARLSNAAKAWAQANGFVLAVGGAAPVREGNLIGPVFPNYGRSKGMPVAGASVQDLEFYANGCRRSLADESKARWHDKERTLLAAIEAELETR
jgi:hypothetical protein